MSRILVVEDEAHLAEGLRFNLEAEGYSVVVTGKGEEALKLLLKEKRDFEACSPEKTVSPSPASFAKPKTISRS
jgi:CheY-like chemotaxis protein